MRELAFRIHEFEEGGYGLLAADGSVIKGATTLDEILAHVGRAAHGVFAPAPRDLAERFAPASPVPIESRRGLLERFAGGSKR